MNPGLVSANFTRKKRAEFRGRLACAQSIEHRAGMIIALISVCPPWAATWKLADVLELTPRWGKKKVGHLMKCQGFGPGKELQDLTRNQKDRVFHEITAYFERNSYREVRCDNCLTSLRTVA